MSHKRNCWSFRLAVHFITLLWSRWFRAHILKPYCCSNDIACRRHPTGHPHLSPLIQGPVVWKYRSLYRHWVISILTYCYTILFRYYYLVFCLKQVLRNLALNYPNEHWTGHPKSRLFRPQAAGIRQEFGQSLCQATNALKNIYQNTVLFLLKKSADIHAYSPIF